MSGSKGNQDFNKIQSNKERRKEGHKEKSKLIRLGRKKSKVHLIDSQQIVKAC
jgi:hypothetical protein